MKNSFIGELRLVLGIHKKYSHPVIAGRLVYYDF